MPWDCLLPSEMVHTLSVECVSCWINLLSLYHGSVLSSFLHKAEEPHLAAHDRYLPATWDMTILSSSTCLQHLELKCRPECMMWVVHPSSPTEAQFWSLPESFFRGNLEAHDDLTVSPWATLICWLQFNCLWPPGFPGAPFLPQKSLWGNLPIVVPHPLCHVVAPFCNFLPTVQDPINQGWYVRHQPSSESSTQTRGPETDWSSEKIQCLIRRRFSECGKMDKWYWVS